MGVSRQPLECIDYGWEIEKYPLILTDYPSYELFTDTLRSGVFGEDSGRQLRLVVGKDRRVKKVIQI